MFFVEAKERFSEEKFRWEALTEKQALDVVAKLKSDGKYWSLEIGEMQNVTLHFWFFRLSIIVKEF